MLVVQPRLQRLLAIPRGADEDWAEVDLCEVQPLRERMDGARLFRGAAANLDLTPAGLGIEGEQGAFVENLDPAARVQRVILVHVETYDFGAAQAASITQEQDRPIPQPAQVERKGGDHREDVLGQDRLFLHWRTPMLALDPSQHGGDMTVVSIEGESALRIIPRKA